MNIHMNEEWKSIAGYEGLYEVSTLGRVRSLGNNKSRKTKVLKQMKNGCGYLKIMLHKNREVKIFSVHRLVAAAFIPNPLNKPQINHKDEDKSNNRVENLEWMTAKENANYGTRNERVAKAIAKPVLQFTKDGKLVAEYSSMNDASRKTVINYNNISECCRSLRKTAGGYVWKYARADQLKKRKAPKMKINDSRLAEPPF